MDEIEEFERRIAAAFDRIAAGLSSYHPFASSHQFETVQSGAAGEADALREELEAERTANAQLTERVKAIREKQETVVAALERTLARVNQQLEAQGRELARQRQVNAQLTETNRALIASHGAADPGLIDHAITTEIEALRAARTSDVAELDAILSELKPLIGEVA